MGKGGTDIHQGLVCARHKLRASHLHLSMKVKRPPLFTDREAEAQRGGIPCLKSHGLGVMGWV